MDDGGGRIVIAALFLGAALCSPGVLEGRHFSIACGTADYEEARALVPVADCGVLAVGDVDYISGGNSDFLLLMLDARGAVEWQCSIGGTRFDQIGSADPAADGGFFLTGSTLSYGAGNEDIWVLKLDGAGQVEWQRAYGGSSQDFGRGIVALPDGGAYVGGTVEVGPARYALQLLRLAAQGDVQWGRSYGSAVPARMEAMAMTPARDGGVVVAGFLEDAGGAKDLLALRVDGTGEIVWQTQFGGDGQDWARAVIETEQGGYLLGGVTVPPATFFFDGWLVLLDDQGGIVWERSYDAGGEEEVRAVAQAPDGGFLAALRSVGRTWLLKLDETGAIEWQEELGTAGFAVPWAMRILPSGEALLSGNADNDLWVLKLNAEGGFDAGGCAIVLGPVADPLVLDTSSTVRDPGLTPGDYPVTVTDTDAVLVETTGAVTEHCGDSTCTALICGEVSGPAGPVCEGTALTFMASPAQCGEGPLTLEWDLDGDTVPDASGNPVTTAPGPGTHTITAIFRDSCASLGPQTCTREAFATVLSSAPPGEVSGAGEARLRVGPRGERLVVEADAEAAAYNVYADRVGSWYSPTAAGGSVCSIRSWTDNGDGTVTLDQSVPAGSWVVVTASTPCAEGPAGPDSDGTERTTLAVWELCGPAP